MKLYSLVIVTVYPLYQFEVHGTYGSYDEANNELRLLKDKEWWALVPDKVHSRSWQIVKRNRLIGYAEIADTSFDEDTQTGWLQNKVAQLTKIVTMLVNHSNYLSDRKCYCEAHVHARRELGTD